MIQGQVNSLRAKAAVETLRRIHEDRKRLSPLLVEFHIGIENHIFDPNLQIETLKIETNLRDATCFSQFAHALGCTPWDYVTDCRLEIAARMLLNSRFKVWQIAKSLGFTSGNSFSRVFTNRFKQNPTEYRENPKMRIPNATLANELINNEQLGRALRSELTRANAESLAYRLRAIESEIKAVYSKLSIPTTSSRYPALGMSFTSNDLTEEVRNEISLYVQHSIAPNQARLYSEALRKSQDKFHHALWLAERVLAFARSTHQSHLIDRSLQDLAVAAHAVDHCHRLLLAQLLSPDIDSDPDLVKAIRRNPAWANHYWWLNRICIKLRNDNPIAAYLEWNHASDNVERLLTQRRDMQFISVANLPELQTRAVVWNLLERLDVACFIDLNESHYLIRLALDACDSGMLDDGLHVLLRIHQGNIFRLQGDIVQASRLSHEAIKDLRDNTDPYIATRVLSIHIDILLERGCTQEALETFEDYMRTASVVRDPEPAWRARLQQAIFLEWQGQCAADLYGTLIEEIERDAIAAPLLLALAKLNRCISLAYHNHGASAEAEFAKIPPFDNGSLELWREYAKALVAESMGNLERARTLYESVVAGFEEIGQGNNSAYVLLHYGLVCLQLGDERAVAAIRTAAEFFASSKVENGRAAAAARAVLAAAKITPELAKKLKCAIRAPCANYISHWD